MYKKILLLHGWGGSDFPHWQSWLAGEIAKDYGCVNFLKFSNFDVPKFETWSKELIHTLNEFKPDIVLCHSLANILWFHLANKGLLPQIKDLYLVAPPSLTCQIAELQEFFPVALPHNLYAQNTTFIYSTNDPYMDEKEAQHLQEQLSVRTVKLENAGHINSDSNFGKWEWILKDIKDLP
ncbi:alpha/beta hydrolase [Sulfurimonas sp. C5]|uniref:RBBP9/YdeN family alpha/beta hydrolase n=1 Tax=Sulfurimonas sp. C5 TaxID=3036947 RepID=UPI002458B124|nr:alpha/beta hydrolase [Sulfurimonas sp. C5]MDH4944290.1 alpha/beta hydrolase [Sulfurimonas sp. C5]